MKCLFSRVKTGNHYGTGIRIRKVHALAWNTRTLFVPRLFTSRLLVNKDFIMNTKVSRLFHILIPTSTCGSTARSRNLCNHYKTEEPNRIKPGTKMMNKAAKVLVTIGAIFIYILIATPILGALNESGASSGLVGLVLLVALIGAIRAIWKKPKDGGDNNSSMLQK